MDPLVGIREMGIIDAERERYAKLQAAGQNQSQNLVHVQGQAPEHGHGHGHGHEQKNFNNYGLIQSRERPSPRWPPPPGPGGNNKQGPRLALYRSNSTQDLPLQRQQQQRIQLQQSSQDPTTSLDPQVTLKDRDRNSDQPDADGGGTEAGVEPTKGGCFPMIRRASRPEFGSQILHPPAPNPKPPAKDSISLNLTSASPRLRAKFQRLFSISTHHNSANESSTKSSPPSLPSAPPRSNFYHYDCQSLLFTLNSASVLLNQRRRTLTLTGASAAHNATRSNSTGALELHSTTPTPTTTGTARVSAPATQQQQQQQHSTGTGASTSTSTSDFDHGDRVNNHMVASCPHFRNEIGLESDLNVAVNARAYSEVGIRPIRASALSVLESNFNCNRRHGHDKDEDTNTDADVDFRYRCIYQPTPSTSTLLEANDGGHDYYRTHFFGKEHESWLGFDPVHGPIVANLKREEGLGAGAAWRVIVRTTQLTSLRGSIPVTPPSNPKIKAASAKDILESMLPEIQMQCLRQAESTKIQDQLLKIDSQCISAKYKVGVLYCRAGQCTEEEMYGNQYGSPEFEQFLDTLGERVRLRGFTGYAGGLDTKGDSTGYESVYCSGYGGCEIMFHVSTLLPFTASNRQQLLRKRHIGNDVVTIVYQEPGSKPFSPGFIRSQFQHVFIIVQRASAFGIASVDPRDVQYSVAVTRAKSTPLFGPRLPPNGATLNGAELPGFLAAKCINGERATIQNTDKFLEMATRTRYEYLKDLIVSNCAEPNSRPTRPTGRTARSSSAHSIGGVGVGASAKSGGMFAVFRKKAPPDPCPQLVPDSESINAKASSTTEGAQAFAVHCPMPSILAISGTTLAIVSLQLRASIFAVPTSSILGWSIQNPNTLRIYYHVGECIEVRVSPGANTGAPTPSPSPQPSTCERIVERLQSVTNGVHVESGNVALGGLYGLQANGWIISDVDEAPGVQLGSRIVEISGVVAATLTQAPHLAELVLNGCGGSINSSIVRETVPIKVVPPVAVHEPRLGCEHIHCPYMRGTAMTDLLPQPLQSQNPNQNQHHNPHQHQLLYTNFYASAPAPGGGPIKYSSSSEGYGTGSSSNSIEGMMNTYNHNRNMANTNNWSSPIRQAWPLPQAQSPMMQPSNRQELESQTQSPRRSALAAAAPSVMGTSMCVSYMAAARPSSNYSTNVNPNPNPNLNEQRLQRLKSTYAYIGGGISGGGQQEQQYQLSRDRDREITPIATTRGRSSASPPLSAVRLRPKTGTGAMNGGNNRISTLQEDLMKLINPDLNISDHDGCGGCGNSVLTPAKSEGGNRRRVRPVSCGEWTINTNANANLFTNEYHNQDNQDKENEHEGHGHCGDTLNNNHNHNHNQGSSTNGGGGGGGGEPLASRVLELEKRLQLERQSKLSLINQLEELRLENERLKAESNSDKSFSLS